MNDHVWARVSGLIVLAVIWFVLVLIRGRFWNIKHLFDGEDHRPSTSKFQFFLWTIVAIYAYSSIYAARFFRGVTEFISTIPPNLLIAMGLSIGTAAVAKLITTSKIQNGELIKTDALAPRAAPLPGQPRDGTVDEPAPAASLRARVLDKLRSAVPQPNNPETGVSRLFVSDDGEPDLAKMQVLAWTFIAIGVYLVNVWAKIDQVFAALVPGSQCLGAASSPGCVQAIGLPDIDPALVVLMGLGQGAYLGPKLVTSITPRLTNVAPGMASESETITLTGMALGEDPGMILVDSSPITAELQPTAGAPKGWSDSQISFKLPPMHPFNVPWSTLDPPLVRIGVHVGGRASNELPFTYRPPDLSIPNATLGDGRIDHPYATSMLTAIGGKAPYSWFLASGTLPHGLSLDPATGMLTGTPTETGLFRFWVGVRDQAGTSATRELSLRVDR